MISKEYAEVMRRFHKEDWGRTAVRYGAGRDVLELLDNPKKQIQTVLDFGCGMSTLGDHIEQERPGRVAWSEYDPGMAGLDDRPKGQYDLVVTCDVLEHVEPKYLDQTIRECADLSSRIVYHNVPCYEAGSEFEYGPYVGKNIHLTVRQPAFWEEVIIRNMADFVIAEVVTIKRHRHDGYRTRVMITSERIRP